MPTVYVPQLARTFDKTQGRMVNKFDTLDRAEKYGTVLVMMDRNDDLWNAEACIAKLKRVMRSFSDEDFLVPMGSHHFMMWAGIIAASKVKNELQTLQWNMRNEEYVLIKTKVTQLRLENSSEEESHQGAAYNVGRTSVTKVSSRRGRSG